MSHKKYWGPNHYLQNKEVPKMVNWVKPNSRVLEFGTAGGYMSRYLKEKLGCLVVGLELNEQEALKASTYCEQIIIANLDHDKWEDQIEGTFDYILFGDVLEHLRSPEGTIKKAINYLKSDGELLLSVPNISHNAIIMMLLESRFNYTEYGILDSTHVHFFSRDSLKSMMNRNGLVCIGEQNSEYPPSIGEFNNFYLRHPFMSINLLLRKDAHVYQYICKWKFANACHTNEEIEFKPKRMSFGKIILSVLDDFNNYLYYKTGKKLSLPQSIKQIVRKK